MSFVHRFVPFAMLLPVTAAAAARAPAPPQPSVAAEIVGIVLPVVLLLAALLAVLHLLRRRHGLIAKDAPLSVVQILPVGPRERLVVVRTRAGRAFAVGVSAQSVRLVAPLEPDDLAERMESVPTSDPMAFVDR